jgi:hypothetical protein
MLTRKIKIKTIIITFTQKNKTLFILVFAKASFPCSYFVLLVF